MAGEIGGIKATPAIWLAAAVIMLVPIAMVVLSVSVGGSPLRWATMAAAVGLFGFNLIGLPGYPGSYDLVLTSWALDQRTDLLDRLDLGDRLTQATGLAH